MALVDLKLGPILCFLYSVGSLFLSLTRRCDQFWINIKYAVWSLLRVAFVGWCV
jgi:hypothetical protein